MEPLIELVPLIQSVTLVSELLTIDQLIVQIDLFFRSLITAVQTYSRSK